MRNDFALGRADGEHDIMGALLLNEADDVLDRARIAQHTHRRLVLDDPDGREPLAELWDHLGVAANDRDFSPVQMFILKKICRQIAPCNDV